MAESRKGKLLGFEPKLDGDGNQETWNKDNKIYYKFTAKFDNDDIGTLQSTFTSPKWDIGVEYTYDKSIHGQQGQFINFNKLKKVDDHKGGKFDPVNNIQTFKSVAIQNAIRLVREEYFNNAINFNDLEVEYNTKVSTITAKFFEFLKEYNTDRMTSINISSALNKAVEFYASFTIDHEKVIEKAKAYFGYITKREEV